jgi:lactobin A/cerein 7B family class IIb bacteriocin
MQELNLDEVEAVGGGVVPLAMALWYTAGGVTGVTAGWAAGRAFFCDK